MSATHLTDSREAQGVGRDSLFKRRRLAVSLAILLTILAWAAIDIYAPLQTDIRRFDPVEAARLELEWWIIHRQQAEPAPGDLERALAELAAEIYQVPAYSMMEHARLRAEAMKIRDTKAESGGGTDEDWNRIDELLRASWQSLHAALQQ